MNQRAHAKERSVLNNSVEPAIQNAGLTRMPSPHPEPLVSPTVNIDFASDHFNALNALALKIRYL
jgi:hypothetical protein